MRLASRGRSRGFLVNSAVKNPASKRANRSGSFFSLGSISAYIQTPRAPYSAFSPPPSILLWTPLIRPQPHKTITLLQHQKKYAARRHPPTAPTHVSLRFARRYQMWFALARSHVPRRFAYHLVSPSQSHTLDGCQTSQNDVSPACRIPVDIVKARLDGFSARDMRAAYFE